MKPRHLIGATLIAFALPFAAIAGYHGDKAGKISEKLGLDEARAAQVEQIFQNHYEGMKALKEQTRQQLQAVLTEEEMEKLNEMKKERRDKHKEMHKEKRKDKEGGY